MASRTRGTTQNADDTAATEETHVDSTEEPTLDNMPSAPEDGAEETTGAAERAKVPKELRPIFNEIGRLSGMLALARRATYNNQPDKVLKALELLEKSVSGAREMAELTVE